METELKNNEKITGQVITLIILSLLTIWGFWPEIYATFLRALKTSEESHALTLPLGIALLILLKRQILKTSFTQGSWWGIALIMLGILIHTLSTWPFSFGYSKDLSIIIVLSGVIAVTCGWKALKFYIPVLILIALSVSIGMRLYANLVIKPETVTLRIAAKLIGMLPGFETAVRGTDVSYINGDNFGVVALGDSNRGARLLFAFAIIAVFIMFSKPRTAKQILWFLFVTPFIIFFVNLARFLSWGLISIIFKSDTIDLLPRNISAIFSLIAAYCLFLFFYEIDLFSLLIPVRKRNEIKDN